MRRTYPSCWRLAAVLVAACLLTPKRRPSSETLGGPRHVFDSEQLWTVQEGRIVVDLAGENCQLEQGDTIVLPAGAARQIHAATDTRILVCGHSPAIVSVPGEPTPRDTPAWIA